MDGKGFWKPQFVVMGALATGFLVGCFFMSLRNARPGFLNGASPILQKEETNSAGIDTVSYYSISGDWLKILAKAKQEFPTSFEYDTSLGGMQAKVLTVPRLENGRLELFYPPEAQITFMPTKLGLGQGKKIVAYGMSGVPWTGIQLKEYRPQHPLDGVVELLRKAFRV